MIVTMLAVVIDTNALYGDPWLASPPGKKLLDLAARGSCLVMYSQVVIDELLRQRREDANRAHEQASKGVRDMAKAGVDVTQTDTDLKASFKKIDNDLATAFQAVLLLPNVVNVAVPDVSASEICRRDLARRRPFVEVDVKQKRTSVGFRDTLIWETVLSILEQAGDYEKVLFVTADKGFLSDDTRLLHQDLLDDLDKRGIDRDRVQSVKNVPNALSQIEAAAVAALVNAATDALYELVGEEVSEQLVYGGDYAYPEFVQFDVPAMETCYIDGVDQTSEFEFTEGQTKGTATGTADAVVHLEGAVHKGDWFADEGETLTVLGELNDHYFQAFGQASVRVVVELDTSGSSPIVLSIALQGD